MDLHDIKDEVRNVKDPASLMDFAKSNIYEI